LQLAGIAWPTLSTALVPTAKAGIPSDIVARQDARLLALESAVNDIKATAITEDRMMSILD
jgi:hypothetical protein